MICTEILMTAEEAVMSGTVGIVRQVRVVTRNRQNDHGSRSWRRQRDRWANQIHGAMAEYAFSRAVDRAWTPGGSTISFGDVGELEVRATEMDNEETCLYVYEEDDDDRIIALAIGHFPRFRFPGAIRAGDGKRKEWWRADANPPCYYVPRQVLIPLADVLNPGAVESTATADQPGPALPSST